MGVFHIRLSNRFFSHGGSLGNDNDIFMLFGSRHRTMPFLVLGFIVDLAFFGDAMSSTVVPHPIRLGSLQLESFLGLYLINYLMNT